MRIITDPDKKDYYDSFQGLDQDYDTLYIRKPVEIPKPDERLNFPNCPGQYWWGNYWTQLPDPIKRINQTIVGFCYKLYPVVEFVTSRPNSIKPDRKFCFNLEHVDAFFRSHFKDEKFEYYLNPKSHDRRLWNKFHGLTQSDWKKYFDECEAQRDNFRPLFDKHKVPIFSYSWPGDNFTLKLNPTLKELEFYRLIPGHEAYQELLMYFGNLAEPRKPIPEVSNEDMIAAKGFDKFSFRKDKKK